MNYIPPTLYFQPGDELCCPITSTSTVIVEDRHQMPQMINPKNPTAHIETSSNCDNSNQSSSNKKKKIMHRDVERQRRHEMAILYASLRSHMPPEYLKGKRSICDLMKEAATYIKLQEEKIQRLMEKRDGLRSLISPSAFSSRSSCVQEGFLLPSVTVRPCYAGVEVVIRSSGPRDGVLFSTVISVLVSEGLDVVSCIYTKINVDSIYTLQSEASNQSEVDFHALQHRLRDLVSCQLGI
ncbi:transcription factor bHLH36-like [Magnolia sinica]|uniref:transcription factor bHLH36-like n=1 Tax=Magnolia sinica TaxID=86752 RepID=UPI00265B4B05|nr:transcription factor bHLH36-like [Magnolia sinica]